MKILVGMSGGVDSSVAALLLQLQGHDVTGISMRIYSGTPAAGKQANACYSPDEDYDIECARSVAESLGIAFYDFDLKDAYRSNVIDYVAREYCGGKTPNPCVRCNQRVKFSALLDKAGLEIAAPVVQAAGERLFQFEHSLKDIADNTYTLVLRDNGRTIASQTVFVMPDYVSITRPFAFERSDPESARFAYQAILAEQYLNLGRPLDAQARLESVPQPARTPAMLSLLAQACYSNREYARVLEILEGKAGGKTFAELTLLANAAIELTLYDKAAGYLEQLRQYGDTAAVNHLLAAAWTALGNAGKARTYHERALELDKINP